MIIATLNEKSKMPGKKISVEGNDFILEGIGSIKIDLIVQLDKSGALDWNSSNIKDKIYSFSGGEAEIPLEEPKKRKNKIKKEKKSKKEETVKEPKIKKEKKSSPLVKTIIVVLSLILVVLGAYVIYSMFFVEETTDIKKNNSIETNDTTMTPVPVVNLNTEKAMSLLSDYFNHLSTKDYEQALQNVSLSYDTSLTAETTPTIIDVVEFNKAVDYTVSIDSTITADILKNIKPLDTSDINIKIYDLSDALLDVVSFKNSFEKSLLPKLKIEWNTKEDTYKIIDENLIIIKQTLSQTSENSVGSTKSTLIVNFIYRTTLKNYLLFDYKDNGSANSILINSPKPVINIENKEISSIIIWNGAEKWNLPQDIKNNVLIFEYTGLKTNVDINWNILRDSTSVVKNTTLNL